MRLYLGTAALQVGVGFILGALLGYLVGVAIQRWRNVRELRRIQQRVAQAKRIHYGGMEYIDPGDGVRTAAQDAHMRMEGIETELRRRKL